MRSKRLVALDRVSFTEDIAVNSLVLFKHPKSGETWHHRMWLRQRFLHQHTDFAVGYSHACVLVRVCSVL